MVALPDEHLFEPGPASKVCRDCGIRKPLDEFPRNKNVADGRHTYCKPCHNARSRETVERLYGSTRHYHLKRRYGIGADDFDRLVAEQGGCARSADAPIPSTSTTRTARARCGASSASTATAASASSATRFDALRAAVHYLDAHDPAATELRALAIARTGELRTTPV